MLFILEIFFSWIGVIGFSSSWIICHKNQIASQNTANDFNLLHLGLMKPCLLEEEKNYSGKEGAKIKHLTPNINIVNVWNMIILTSSRTQNNNRNMYILFDLRKHLFSFATQTKDHEAKNAFKGKKTKKKKINTNMHTQTRKGKGKFY